MKTICIQIGNSDDKLSQKRWSEYVQDVNDAISLCQEERHFYGGSFVYTPWQNACWVIGIYESNMLELFARLTLIATEYDQDGIATLTGEVVFI